LKYEGAKKPLMSVKGVVMAGGQGTRFRPISNYVQKCMVPIGEQEKPVLEYILRLFRYHGIHDLALLVNYKHKQIMNYFDGGSRFGLRVKYIQDRPGLKGSANALLNAYHIDAVGLGDTLVVYYGDILSNLDLTEMLNLHEREKPLATIALSPNYSVSVGVAELSGTQVTRFLEKPKQNINATIGVLVLDGSILTHIERLQGASDKKSLDLMGDIIQSLVSEGEKITGYLTDAFWYDIGSLERYERLKVQDVKKFLDYLL
jgi:mannose-1-phosphate guanylyltransferase